MHDRDKPNEKWWADHGGDWYQECQRRRAEIPYYMNQEVFLSGYFSMAAPCRALEFGCGFGRQLSYLRRIPGLDLYGCDQSPTMLAEAEKLIEKPWLDEHVRRVPPAGRLPYEDKSFDIVYSVSVLIHVQPEDIAAVLRELVRVARWHVLHIENPPTRQTVMTCTEHDGCWAHPLEALYAEAGLRLEALPSHGTIQGCYRVMLDERRPAPDVAALAGRLSEAETRFNAARHGLLSRVQQSEAAASQQRDQIAAQAADAHAKISTLQRELDESRAESERQRQINVETETRLARTVTRMQEDLNQARSEADRQRQIRAEAATKAQQEMEAIIEQSAGLRTQLQAATKAQQEMEADIRQSAGLRAQLQTAASSLQAAQSSVAALQERVHWLEQNLARIEGSLTWKFMLACNRTGLLAAPCACAKTARRLFGGKSGPVPTTAPAPAAAAAAPPPPLEFHVPLPVTSQAFADMLKLRPVSFNRVYGAPALMSPQERVLLYGLTFAMAPQRYLEIGTCRGGSAVVVSAAMDDLKQGQAFGVDPEPAVSAETLAAINHRFTLVTGASPHAVARAMELAGGAFDLVLVDGDHSYEATLADLVGVLPATTPDAVILVHDAYNALVGRAITDFLAMQDGQVVDGGILATTRNPIEENGRVQDWGGLRMLRRRPRPAKVASIHA